MHLVLFMLLLRYQETIQVEIRRSHDCGTGAWARPEDLSIVARGVATETEWADGTTQEENVGEARSWGQRLKCAPCVQRVRDTEEVLRTRVYESALVAVTKDHRLA